MISASLACCVLAGCGGGSTSAPAPVPTAATPTFSVAGGTFTAAQTVSLSDATVGTTIYYTLDGTTPTTASKVYTTALTIASTTTVNSIAAETGYTTSAVASATYTINTPTAAAPVFSPAGGTYTTAQTVTLTAATAGSTIYYTMDGSVPTTSSTKYTTPITVSASETLNAISVASGYANSAVSSAAYVIAPVTATTVVSVVLSTHDQTNLMAQQGNVAFGTNAASTNQVVVDDTQLYQTMDGFGASFTDSAAYLLEEVTPSSQLGSALNDLFTRNGAGIGLSFMRLHRFPSRTIRPTYCRW